MRDRHETGTCEGVCVCVRTYLKELRWWNRTIGFLAPRDHLLREKCLVEEEEGGERDEEADREYQSL